MDGNMSKVFGRFAAAIGLACAVSFGASAMAQAPGEYRVVDGKVDQGTYTGWKLFHTACYGCHGTDAVGTDLAPNLVQRVRFMTPRAFAAKVLSSYRLVRGSDSADPKERATANESMLDEIMRRQRGGPNRIVMPAWENSSQVAPHVLDLFAYLSARGDGSLGPGRPGLLVAKKSAKTNAR
jgi:mono/diheme cytochrome c family protein